MMSSFQKRLFNEVVSGLKDIGYRGELLQHGYHCEDWFAARTGGSSKVETADAAAFGRKPLGHDNACFAVIVSGDLSGPALVSRQRSLGAPLAFEVTPEQVLLWPVRANGMSGVRPIAIPPERLGTAFSTHADDWSPAAVLRAKNIVPSPTRERQLDFIDIGLMPALEEHVREKLDPLLRSTFFAAMATYRNRKDSQPEPGKLFRLVFRVLAGKVLTDRGATGFQKFKEKPPLPPTPHSGRRYDSFLKIIHFITV